MKKKAFFPTDLSKEGLKEFLTNNNCDHIVGLTPWGTGKFIYERTIRLSDEYVPETRYRVCPLCISPL